MKRLLFCGALFVGAFEASGASVITWSQDSIYGFSVHITGFVDPVQQPDFFVGPANSFGVTDFNSPSGLWHIDSAGGNVAPIQSGPPGFPAALHSWAGVGSYLGETPFDFHTPGTYISFLPSIPGGASDLMYSDNAAGFGWTGLVVLQLVSFEDISDPATWAYSVEMTLQAPEVPDQGSTGWFLGLVSIGMMLRQIVLRKQCRASCSATSDTSDGKDISI